MLSKEKLKQIMKLKTKKGRKQRGMFLIEGLKLCEEAVGSGWWMETVLFTSSFEEKPTGKRLLRRLRGLGADLIQARTQDLAKLSETVTAQGIICVGRIKDLGLKELWRKKPKVILGLDHVGDPGNVGTLIRTADAFGVDAVILSENSAESLNPKVVRSTMGSIFHLEIVDDVDLEKAVIDMKRRRFRIIGTNAKEGKTPDELKPWDKICLLVGSEPEGLSKNLLKLSDEIVRVPACGKAESLNVAVAGGILLYEVTRKRMRTRLPR